jgi:cytochrome c556
MRRTPALVIGTLLGALALIVIAADKPPDDYAKLMKDFGSALQGVNKAVQAEDFEAVTKNIVVVIDGLPAVEKFWSNRAGAQDAQKLVEAAKKSAGDLRVAAGLKSGEGVTYSMKELGESCSGCHSAHRDKGADGSFLIK